jgi:outer membrane protein OmpA-like peptidoglycan-associated protein
MRRVVLSLLVLGLLAACASTSEVDERGRDIQKLIDQKRDACYVCAPAELARAEAHLEIARYQSTLGNGIYANWHLERALEAIREAWTRSNYQQCAPDSDDDGLPDTMDACPNQPEDYDGERDDDGCPDLDQDGDGVDDDKDVCPGAKEDRDGFQDADGCPDPDNDADGFPDLQDGCPVAAEDRDGFQDHDGCPDADNDADGFPDLQDACPNQPEDLDGDQDQDGCPDVVQYQSIVVTAKTIELKQTIFFATGSDRILPQSFGLLNEIVDVLTKRGDMRLRIEGHTDTKGAYKMNKALSQKRADSVKRYLVSKGVDKARLQTEGFGPDRPVDDNNTDAGRANNRRVEFHILD